MVSKPINVSAMIDIRVFFKICMSACVGEGTLTAEGCCQEPTSYKVAVTALDWMCL